MPDAPRFSIPKTQVFFDDLLFASAAVSSSPAELAASAGPSSAARLRPLPR